MPPPSPTITPLLRHGNIDRATKRPKLFVPTLLGILAALLIDHLATLPSHGDSIRSDSNGTITAATKTATKVTKRSTLPRKVYIDVGANCGITYWRIKKGMIPSFRQTLTGPDWEAYLWEANPQLVDWFLRDLAATEPNVTVVPMAAATYTGDLTLYLTQGQETVTKELLNNPTCDPTSPYTPTAVSTVYRTATRAGTSRVVPALDFVAWHVALNVTTNDTVHVKMDIEGSEMSILQALLLDETNQMCTWEQLWCRFHKDSFAPGSVDAQMHIAFEATFPSLFAAKCGRPLVWSAY